MRSLSTRSFGTALLGGLVLLGLLMPGAGYPVAAREHEPPVASVSSVQTSEPEIVRIYVIDQAAADALAASGLDLLETRGPDYLLALATAEEQQAVIAKGYRVEVDEEQTNLLRAAPGAPDGPPGYPCYRSVPTIERFVEDTAAAYPHLVELVDFGDSWEKVMPGGPAGHDLWSLRITNRSVVPPDGQQKPRFFLMAGIHARELVTPEVALFFIAMLLEGHGVDADLTWLVDHHEIWVVPMANPDGRDMAETGLYWRKNTDNDDGCQNPTTWGTDLNRNHSFEWNTGGSSGNPCSETFRGPSAGSEPETEALESLMGSLFPDQRGPGPNDAAPDDTTGIMITLHSFGELVLWPWGNKPVPPPNVEGLRAIGDKFAFYNGYLSCQSGPCLYSTSGATDDWAYGVLGVPAYTFELGTTFFQSCSALDEIWERNRQALLYAARVARTPYLLVKGPDVLSPTVAPTTVVAGQSAGFSAWLDDRASGGDVIVGGEAYMGLPPWLGAFAVPLRPADGAFDSPVEQVRADLDTSQLSPGRHLVYVRGQDAGGHWGPLWATWLHVGDFSLAVSGPADLCAPADAIFSVTVDALGGYASSLTLETTGLPAGVVADFQPPAITPPGQASLTLHTAQVATSRAVTMTVTGTGPEGLQRSAETPLRLAAGVPLAPDPQEPDEGAVDVDTMPALRWHADALWATYRVQVARDVSFDDLVVDANSLAGSQYVLEASLQSQTTYHWRVQATNFCGPSVWSPTRTFMTAALGTYLPLILR